MKTRANSIFVLLACMLGMHCDLDRIDDAGPFVCGEKFTDPRDGKTYKTVWIANDGSHDLAKPGKCWMAENLDFNTANFHSNCYNQEVIRCDTFGHMYGGLALNNCCMNGWHVATTEDWNNLFLVYGWTQGFTGNGPIYFGDSTTFLAGGSSKLDFLMGGSCLDPGNCEGSGESIGFWATDKNEFCFFNIQGSADVWSTAVIVGATDLRYYVRCIQN